MKKCGCPLSWFIVCSMVGESSSSRFGEESGVSKIFSWLIKGIILGFQEIFLQLLEGKHGCDLYLSKASIMIKI